MWLGRTDFRMHRDADATASQVFRRRAVRRRAGAGHAGDAARSRRSWTSSIAPIQAFVGESDNMRVPEFAPLLARPGRRRRRRRRAALRRRDDRGGDRRRATTARQRISSHIMINGLGRRDAAAVAQLPAVRPALRGRLARVLERRVTTASQGGQSLRMMPDPLDVAFAALGNNQAVPLLRPQLDQYRLRARSRGDARARRRPRRDFWNANLYNLWLASLRALSPWPPARRAPLEIAGTEAWGRRTLNTQLASWAELRHDTILYAKQSYTGGAGCEFPDALVEPSPEFFARLGGLRGQGHGGRVVAAAGSQRWPQSVVRRYFEQLATGRADAEGDGGAPGAGHAVHRGAHGVHQRDRARSQHGLRRRPRRERLVLEAVLRRQTPSSSRPPSPTCTPSRPTRAATPSARCCTWAPATRGSWC